jgi:hypothetical protein
LLAAAAAEAAITQVAVAQVDSFILQHKAWQQQVTM